MSTRVPKTQKRRKLDVEAWSQLTAGAQADRMWEVVARHERADSNQRSAVRKARRLMGELEIASDTPWKTYPEKKVVTLLIVQYLKQHFKVVVEEQTVIRQLEKDGKVERLPGSSRSDIVVVEDGVYVGIEVKPEKGGMRSAVIQSLAHTSVAAAAILGSSEYAFPKKNANLPWSGDRTAVQQRWDSLRRGVHSAAAVVCIVGTAKSKVQGSHLSDKMPASLQARDQYASMLVQLQSAFSSMPKPHTAFDAGMGLVQTIKDAVSSATPLRETGIGWFADLPTPAEMKRTPEVDWGADDDEWSNFSDLLEAAQLSAVAVATATATSASASNNSVTVNIAPPGAAINALVPSDFIPLVNNVANNCVKLGLMFLGVQLVLKMQ
jgi:hypothetical protein